MQAAEATYPPGVRGDTVAWSEPASSQHSTSQASHWRQAVTATGSASQQARQPATQLTLARNETGQSLVEGVIATQSQAARAIDTAVVQAVAQSAGNQGQPEGAPLPGVVLGVPELKDEEVHVLNYRLTIMCLSIIDACATLATAVESCYVTLIDELLNDDSSSYPWTGIMGILGIIFLIGPACGWIGAKRLNRNLVTVYFTFTAARLVFQVMLVAFTFNLLYIMLFLLQVYVTKLVATFWAALKTTSREICQEVLKNNSGRRLRMMYW